MNDRVRHSKEGVGVTGGGSGSVHLINISPFEPGAGGGRIQIVPG